MTAFGPPPAVPPGGPATPPTGPGVQPPFAAPPIDGDRTRVWVGLGVGAAALVLCCLGGVAGFGGLLYTGIQAQNERARATVSGYLNALSAEDYVKAYSLLCDRAQNSESVQAFTERVSDEPHVDAFTLGRAQFNQEIVLPADVRFDDGQQRTVRFQLEDDVNTGELEVCGVE
jgi:hypothetical protein